MSTRAARFLTVGAGGFCVQIALLTLLIRAGWPLTLATAAAVEGAILHNFWWHERWTWRDCTDRIDWPTRLGRFHAATGLVSLGCTVALTWVFARTFALPPAAANTLAVGMAGVANFVIADRWVFAPQPGSSAPFVGRETLPRSWPARRIPLRFLDGVGH